MRRAGTGRGVLAVPSTVERAQPSACVRTVTRGTRGAAVVPAAARADAPGPGGHDP
ncbi:hypothetical protein ACU61A_04090 [Pseudonocardia sichuanensis]